MPVAPSFDDFLAQFEAEAQNQRPALAFADGDVTEAMAHGSGAMADANLRYAAQAVKETFLDGAEGDALTALVDDHYNLQRFALSFAEVALTFARTSGGAAGMIPSGTTVATTQLADGSEVRFVTDAPIVVALGNNGPFPIGATATVAGSGGNAAAGTIVRVVDSLFDTFTVTNAAKAGGGNDDETDPELRVRARNFWTTLRRGTLAALEFGALRVPTVRISKAVENTSTGAVTLVVSDSDGNSTAQMIADVQTEIENWRAAGALVTVVGGTQLLVDVIGVMVVEDGVDAAVLGPLADASIAARMRKLRQGETLQLDTVKAAGIAVDPDGMTAINLTTPSANVTPSPFQVIRPGTISIT